MSQLLIKVLLHGLLDILLAQASPMLHRLFDLSLFLLAVDLDLIILHLEVFNHLHLLHYHGLCLLGFPQIKSILQSPVIHGQNSSLKILLLSTSVHFGLSFPFVEEYT